MPRSEHGRHGSGQDTAEHGIAAGDGHAARTGHVVVCGLDGLGVRVVEQLRAAGQDVVVVDEDAPEALRREVRRLGAGLVVADATEAEALDAAGLAGASAVVCVERDDLRSLRVALVARDRRADVRVVTGLANAAVGRAVAGGTVGPGGRGGAGRRGPDTVLDVAALASPTLVEACVQSPVHALDVAGHRFLSASVTASRAGTLRELYGDLVPLAVTPDRGPDPDPPAPERPGSTAHGAAEPDPTTTGPAETTRGADTTAVCPGRDHAVRPGDRVVLLGVPDELAAVGVETTDPSDRRSTRRGAGRDPALERPGNRRLRRAVAALVQLVREADRGLGWALVALLALIVVSTVVINTGYADPGMTVVDALYFTVESVATVGFGDYSFADQALWLRLWAVFLMLAGVVTTAIPIAFFTDMLISRRLAATAGRRRASGARGHVVLIGLGAVGVAVLTALRERGRDVVVVERDPGNRFLDSARALNVPVVFGDATTAETLAAARVPRAAAVAVLTSDDMANIETGLAVREILGASWADVPVVLRLLDRELARTAADRFEFGFVRSVGELAAPWFVGGALGLDVLGTFPVHGRAFLLGHLTVAPGSGLDGLALRELSARTRVVALRRAGDPDGLEHPPRRDTRVAAGDEAYLVGPYSELLDVLRHHRSGARGDAAGSSPDTDPDPDPDTDRPRPRRVTRTDTVVGLIAAFVTGAFIVGQARVNAELGVELGDGILAALVSFSTGLVLLLLLVALLPAGRRGLRRVRVARAGGRLRAWQLLGGLGGALLVAGQGLTAALLGTALFTIAVVAGQSAGGLVVDRVGLGPAGPQATTPPRLAGAVLMLGAVVLSVAPSLRTEAPVALALLPLAAGVAIATQQALNGQVAAAAGHREPDSTEAVGGRGSSIVTSVLPAATINFVVGALALLLASVVAVAVLGPPHALPGTWWLYLGGPFGAIFIGLGAWVVGRIGVLLLALGAVAGQVVTAVVVDAVAPAAAGPPGLTTVLGAALTLLAAGLAALPWRRRRAAAPPADGPGARADLPS